MNKFLNRFHWFGIAGSILMAAAVMITSLTFHSSDGGHYSMLNRFISELGWVGTSQNAWIFNSSMILTGLLFIPFCIGLGLRIPNAWAKAGLATGILSAIFCALVGVFPMNHLPPHTFVAMWYFRSALVTILLFGIAILVQPRNAVVIHRAASVFSLLAALAYGTFLVLAAIPHAGSASAPTLSALNAPPPFRLLACVEWLVFFSTVLWFLGIALIIMRGKKRYNKFGSGTEYLTS